MTSHRGLGGPVSWSRPSGPHVLLSARCELSPLSYLSAVCESRRDRVPSGPGRLPQSTACQGRAGSVDGGRGRACLALTAVYVIRNRSAANSSRVSYTISIPFLERPERRERTFFLLWQN